MNAREMKRFVQDQMKIGEDSSRIMQQLTDRGVSKNTAMRVVEEVSNQMLQSPLPGPGLAPQGSSLAPAVLGGLLAAALGGGVWALIAIASDYEIGFVAWGIGALCGGAVLLFAKGQRGVPLQVIAVVCSILGILIGKYGTFYYIYQQVFAEQYGEELASELSLFSPVVLTAFSENISELVGSYDILWMVLAVVTAWGIPKVAAPDPEATDQQP